MISRVMAVMITAILLISCSFGYNDPVARKTLNGASTRQVLTVAQYTLTQKGYDVEQIEYENGVLTTIWDNRPERKTKYEIKVTPASSVDKDIKTDITIEITAKTKDRVVGGWSKTYDARLDSNQILDEIVEMVTKQMATQAGELSKDTAAEPTPKEIPAPPVITAPPVPIQDGGVGGGVDNSYHTPTFQPTQEVVQ